MKNLNNEQLNNKLAELKQWLESAIESEPNYEKIRKQYRKLLWEKVRRCETKIASLSNSLKKQGVIFAGNNPTKYKIHNGEVCRIVA